MIRLCFFLFLDLNNLIIDPFTHQLFELLVAIQEVLVVDEALLLLLICSLLKIEIKAQIALPSLLALIFLPKTASLAIFQL